MIICIPTHNRETVNEQTTIRRLPKSLYDKVYFFTCETKVDKLREVIPEECHIIPVPFELGEYGIAGKRQFILEWAYNNNHRKIWQIDDGCTFHQNIGPREDGKGPMIRVINDNEELVQYLDEMFKLLDDYPVVGTLNRAGTFRDREGDKCFLNRENGRLYTNIAMDTKILVENDIRFDILQKEFNDQSLSIMEDYAMLLQLVSKGFKSLQMGNWCFDKTSFVKGGCSGVRNAELQKKTAECLRSLYPNHVTVVEAKDSVKKDVKYNVRIAWKKFSDENIKKVEEIEEW